VIAVRDIMRPPPATAAHFTDVYLVYELMDTDLHQIIRSTQALSDDHFQYFVYQVGTAPGTAAGAAAVSAIPIVLCVPGGCGWVGGRAGWYCYWYCRTAR
jgi:hypothetical protein